MIGASAPPLDSRWKVRTCAGQRDLAVWLQIMNSVFPRPNGTRAWDERDARRELGLDGNRAPRECGFVISADGCDEPQGQITVHRSQLVATPASDRRPALENRLGDRHSPLWHPARSDEPTQSETQSDETKSDRHSQAYVSSAGTAGMGIKAAAGVSCHIAWLGVLPDARRRGAARALLGWAERRALELGAGEIAAETLASWPVAVAFYRGCGYS
ncbi:MAG: GNAT family N-acetyltransferase [Planctomycetales bacterium]|nr:GNAT family N-acetyltransferase [Planctomycetales bacterium]MCA9167550.1 GNAT family N-acetyltransferase [Planctomycetales bacterium]